MRMIDGELYFEDLALAASHDPRAMNAARRDAWMAERGAKRSTTPHPCLGHVRNGKGHGSGCYGVVSEHGLCRARRDHGGWFDHVELFWIPAVGEYVFTSQPYDVSMSDWEAMQAFAEKNGLRVTISIEDAWWYPGRTPLIVWRRGKGGG